MVDRLLALEQDASCRNVWRGQQFTSQQTRSRNVATGSTWDKGPNHSDQHSPAKLHPYSLPDLPDRATNGVPRVQRRSLWESFQRQINKNKTLKKTQ